MESNQQISGEPIGTSPSGIAPTRTRNRRILLVTLSGILLGLAFPPSPFGVFAFIAFVPFFMLFEEINSYGRAIRTTYAALLIFNVMTLYWIGGFTHMKDPFLMIAGVSTVLGHPLFTLFMIPPWIFIKRQFGHRTAVAAFPFFYVAYEYLHSLSEYAFPWLLLGNTQSYDLPAIQLASVTGVYGISFWVLVINVLLYFLARAFVERGLTWTSPKTMLRIALILALYLAPKVCGHFMIHPSTIPPGSELRIAAIQPNIDPFDKWSDEAHTQIAIHESLSTEALKTRPDLILWSETAIPERILHPNHLEELADLHAAVNSYAIPVLTGMVDTRYYPDSAHAPRSSKVSLSGFWYDDYNSTMLLTPGTNQLQKYHKIKLVPYAERVPYSDVITFLNVFRWNLGIGGWGIGKDTTIFSYTDQHGNKISFANLICYESIFPGFDAEFVRKGAQFLTVVTNDSWWGNTSGTYQHRQIAAMRAVENRRWVVQCANGGISCIVDPYGRIVAQTPMYRRTILEGDIQPLSSITFYTQHGDWFAEGCLVVSLFFIVAALGSAFYKRTRLLTAESS